MKALVTGGAGLIGSHIVDELLKKGYAVRIVDNLEPETHRKGKPEWVPKEAEFIQGDIAQEEVVVKALRGVDVVLHQAAYGGFTPNLTKYVHSNTIGTLNIFKVIKEEKLPVKKVVYASSQAVYGEGKYACKTHGVQEPEYRGMTQLEKRQWEVQCPKCKEAMEPRATDEGKKLEPSTMYAVTKYTEELIALPMGKALGVPTVGLRYAVTYGSRQSLFNPYTGICSIFSTRILNGLPPIIYEDGRQTRDFVFVEDVAKANVFVLEHDEANDQVFNVGTGKQTDIITFVQYLSEAYGKEPDYLLPNEFRPGDVRHLFSDNTKLKKLGFTPAADVREGIKKYTKWILAQGVVEEYFSKYRGEMEKMGITKKTV